MKKALINHRELGQGLQRPSPQPSPLPWESWVNNLVELQPDLANEKRFSFQREGQGGRETLMCEVSSGTPQPGASPAAQHVP